MAGLRIFILVAALSGAICAPFERELEEQTTKDLDKALVYDESAFPEFDTESESDLNDAGSENKQSTKTAKDFPLIPVNQNVGSHLRSSSDDEKYRSHDYKKVQLHQTLDNLMKKTLSLKDLINQFEVNMDTKASPVISTKHDVGSHLRSSSDDIKYRFHASPVISTKHDVGSHLRSSSDDIKYRFNDFPPIPVNHNVGSHLRSSSDDITYRFHDFPPIPVNQNVGSHLRSSSDDEKYRSHADAGKIHAEIQKQLHAAIKGGGFCRIYEITANSPTLAVEKDETVDDDYKKYDMEDRMDYGQADSEEEDDEVQNIKDHLAKLSQHIAQIKDAVRKLSETTLQKDPVKHTTVYSKAQDIIRKLKN